jgi:hypothetical protein
VYFNFLTKKIVTMKKTLMTFIICIIFQCSCTVIQDAPPAPTAPPCDNTVSNFTLGLDFAGTSYLCTYGIFGTHTPPKASAFYYATAPSADATIGSLSGSLSYLCQMTVKNDQPSENPNLPCTNPGTMSFVWSTAGFTQNIKTYTNANSDITVDYYDVCDLCSATITKGRPYFAGVITVPKGAVSATVSLQTQQPYVGAGSDPCQ